MARARAAIYQGQIEAFNEAEKRAAIYQSIRAARTLLIDAWDATQEGYLDVAEERLNSVIATIKAHKEPK